MAVLTTYDSLSTGSNRRVSMSQEVKVLVVVQKTKFELPDSGELWAIRANAAPPAIEDLLPSRNCRVPSHTVFVIILFLQIIVDVVEYFNKRTLKDSTQTKDCDEPPLCMNSNMKAPPTPWSQPQQDRY
eukprot:GFYU01026918.1.p1 GENE.GFYU01026918.1~~GFYU01026918.1.p1  ORF type:complete len:129 (-),score=1.34 GFYU01026918.1:211-597(-)